MARPLSEVVTPVDSDDDEVDPERHTRALVYLGPRATKDGSNIMAKAPGTKREIEQLTSLRYHPVLQGFPAPIDDTALKELRYPHPEDMDALACSSTNKRALQFQSKQAQALPALVRLVGFLSWLFAVQGRRLLTVLYRRCACAYRGTHAD